MYDGSKFEHVLLGARGTSANGSFSVTDAGITWKKNGGMTPQLLKKADIAEAIWTLAPAGGLLRVRQHNKVTANFHGFTKADESRLRNELLNKLDIELQSQDMLVAGHNWGQISVHGSSLAFESVDGKHIFELPLTEIGDIQGTKEDTILEFHVDDGTISTHEDALCSVTFVIPEENKSFPADPEEGKTAAEVFKAAIMDKTDALAGEGDALAELEHVSCVFPRGRFDLSLYPGFMVMDGQNSQFRIRYSNIERIYQLPRPQPPGNLVLVHLENAIRRGQTYYEWIAFFFDANSYADDLHLNSTQEFLNKKNEENRANMELVMSGPKEDVLTRLLRGLSGSKVTKQGKFAASDDSPFLACNHRTDAGVLYPLQRAFLYTFKPELIPYDHIQSVEFERQQSGMHAASVRTFDLAVTIRPEAATRTKTFLFRGIMKQEWEPLLNFLEEKSVRILNLDQARQGPGFAHPAPLAGMDLDGDDDSDEDDEFGAEDMEEDDEEFRAGGAGSSSGSSDDDSDAELIPEDGISVEAVGGKPSKRARKEEVDDVEDEENSADNAEEIDEEEEEDVPPKPAKKKATKEKAAKGGKEEKKGRKKKDPSMPKRGTSAFMHFSNAKRAEVKEQNPGIAFGEIGKKLGEMWKAYSPEEKKPYLELAEKDKARYEREMEEYKKTAKDDEIELSDDEDDALNLEEDTSTKPRKEEKKSRKKKDPNEPKRVMTAFMHFSTAKRAEVKEQNPGIAFGEIGRKLGEIWKSLDGEDKQIYLDMAEKDKLRYEREITEYKKKLAA